MLCDYHLHTYHCRHAEDKAEAYAAAAWAKGLDEIGFADHIPALGWPEDVGRAMPAAELETYIQEVEALKLSYPGRVRLGLEADFMPGYEKALSALKARYPFDYWLGSVHVIPAWSYGYLRDYRERPSGEAYRRYFTLVGEAARSGLYDSLAHLDLLRRFVPEPPPEELAALEAALVAQVAQAGVAVEINSSALRGPMPEIGLYPGPRLLSGLREAGVPITLGSDAHRPGEAGTGLRQAVAAARAAGYDTYVRFEHGDRLVTPLPE